MGAMQRAPHGTNIDIDAEARSRSCARAARQRSIVLVALALACAPSAGRRTSPPGASGSAAAPKPDSTGPCPAIDYAALEPATRHPDSRTIELTRVFQREEARATVVTVPAPFDLDVMRVGRPAPGPKLGGGIGLGWMGLEASWVASVTSPEVEAPLASWLAEREALGEHQRGSYLLDTRVRYARSVDDPPPAWGGLRCVEEAAAQADRDESQAEAATERAAEALRGALEALASRRPGDELLLGHLLEAQLTYPYEPKAAERPIALYSKVANDEALDRELRARAAEQLARVHGPGSNAFVRTLEQVLSLTKDPELAIETLVKLADVADFHHDAAKAEALRVRILERLGPQGESWRVAQTLASLAQARLDRGAFELARDDAARCAQQSAADFALDPDPWGCAPVLAEALAELAQAPAGVKVPLAFLGPLAIASMESALERHDHEQAKHVGMLLLGELPEAAEAPEALAMLMGIVQSDDERAELAAKQEREYGPQSAWAEQQRQRLAWDHEPAEVEQQLASLREPERAPVVVRLPTTPAELTTELRARATMVGETCAATLPKGRRAVRISVDTSGILPIATVRGARPTAEACLRRATESRFRSVGPVRISFGLALE
jgi:hypothetical protein